MAEQPEIIDEEDGLAPATTDESTALGKKFAVLKARCESAKIEFVQHNYEEGGLYATISLQAGRSKRRLAIFSERRSDALLAVAFERYRFISGYDAICCYEEGRIEASLRTTTRMPARFILQRLLGQRAGSTTEIEPITLTSSLPGRPTIEVGPCSAELGALLDQRGPRVSLKLTGVRVSQHDQALAELRSYADSIFFQIDSMFGSSFILERERRIRIVPPLRRPTEIKLAYPSARYNHEAMSLYWYAKSAGDMPLLRFLAYYQSLEFYFPRYSQIEARRRVSSILKQPTFRTHSDDDVDRLISAIHAGRGGGLGTERSQLRAVLNECIGADEMRQYLTATTDRGEHFLGKAPRYHKIPLANKNADLRNDVADRIYDIRCKIVHTKNEHSDDDVPMILPFSEDADYLLHDIELAEFVARSVLISSSGELS